MADTDPPSAPSRPAKLPVVVGIVVLALAGFVGLNVMAAQFRPKSDEEEQEALKAAAAANATPTPAATPGAAPGQELVALGAAGIVGDPTTPTEVVVGYAWTPQVQADPSKVYAAIDTLHKALPMGHVRVVNVDQNAGTPEGVSVAGKVLYPTSPDGSLMLAPGAIGSLMMAVMSSGGGPPGGMPPGGPGGMPPTVAASPSSPGQAPVKK